MKIRTKTKERLLSEGWEGSTGNLRKEGDNAFGVWAWSVRTLEKAKSYLK